LIAFPTVGEVNDIIRPISQDQSPKRILCVSWDPGLAVTRHMLLRHCGYSVLGALGPEQAADAVSKDVDLLVLGHSVPQAQKRRLINTFRTHSRAPILSMLEYGQSVLPEATAGLDATDPAEFLVAVKQLLS
jgi:CheY-like chemotaxis protein